MAAGLTRQLGERLDARLDGVPDRAGRAGRELQHAAASDRPHRAASPSARRTSTRRSPARRSRPRSARTASRRRRRSGFAQQAGRGVRAADARADAEGRVPRLPEAPARARAPSTRCPTSSAACSAIWRFPSRCTGTRRSTTGGASCCSAARSAGCCFSTAAASCRSRSAAPRSAAGPQVQDVESGALTYGHRFLATSGRAGRSIKVRSFDEYQARLTEHFVVLDHAERRDRIARDLEMHARRLGGRVHAEGASPRSSRRSPTSSSIRRSSPASSTPAFLALPRGSARRRRWCTTSTTSRS